MAQVFDWSKFDEIRKSQTIEGSGFQAIVRCQKGNICDDVRGGHKSFELGNERQKVRLGGRRSSITDTWLLAGISDARFIWGKMRGLHESNVSRIVQKIEDILIKCGKFSLPGKKRLLADTGLTYTIVDVMEMTVERPKKNKSGITAGKRSGTL